MAEQTNYDEVFFNRADTTLRVHGILSIVFGGLGVLFGLLFLLLITVGAVATYQLDDVVGAFALGLFALILWILPHIYLIIAGVQLLKQPDPKVAKTLVIINLVIGVFWNLVLLIFAIINLTQLSDYEQYYKKFADRKK